MVVMKLCVLARRGGAFGLAPGSASQFQKRSFSARSAATRPRAARSCAAVTPGSRGKCSVVNSSGSPSLFTTVGRLRPCAAFSPASSH